jgi:hypothetical protein
LDSQTVLANTGLYSDESDEVDLLLGTFEFVSGEHVLAVEALGADDGESRCVALEMLRLLKLPPEAVRAVKTHNEAHFVRLAIGRAAYAFRLAFGELPQTLRELVDAEVLPAKFLADENGHPLKSWREGDYLVVESTAPNGWTHRWQGLDARR